MQIKKSQSDDRFNMKSKSRMFRISSFYGSWVIHFCFMFWNKIDHKKYGFVSDISYFKSENGANMKLSRADFLYKQKR